ncbi:hypothetical protein DL237_05515 [Pseudooceanicola sediminis]|uniref:Uncharacterized protein n=1 Tax=Pseudooceanicola sediminis TaxID=2211117 RepID=A0A399J2F4_9RHOB|nr:hypothetical protein DL237_05515 [Pseudooceanicola sediminis]
MRPNAANMARQSGGGAGDAGAVGAVDSGAVDLGAVGSGARGVGFCMAAPRHGLGRIPRGPFGRGILCDCRAGVKPVRAAPQYPVAMPP